MRLQYSTRLATTPAAAGALVLTAPTGAHATAIGTTPVRTFEYSVGGMTMKIPTGCMFTHIIRGDGRRITYQNAGVDCAFVAALSSGFCNWRIDFTYADTDDRTYRTSRGRRTPSARSTRCGTTLPRRCLVMERRVPTSMSTECTA